MSKTEELIWQLAEPLCEEEGLELVDVEFVKEGEWYLRIFIDTLGEEKMGLDQCEVVSRKISKVLDETDPIVQAYRLEVSSPGIERPLKKDKDFLRFQGRKVKVRFFKPWNGAKELEGILGAVTADVLMLEGTENYEIPRTEISKVNLVWDFNNMK